MANLAAGSRRHLPGFLSGQSVARLTNDDSSRHSIWLLAIPGAEAGTGALGPVRIATGEIVAWSPDSSKLAYSAMSDDPLSRERSIAYVSVDRTMRATLLTGGQESSPRWSPDGQSLVFLGNGGLFSTDLLGSYERLGDFTPSFAWVTR